MEDQSQNVFIPIGKNESQNIINHLRTTAIDVIGRSEDQSLLLLTSTPVKSADWLVFIYRGKVRLQSKQEVIFTFNHAGEKYFFRSPCTPRGAEITTRGEVEVFKVLRRADYRLTVPASYEATFQLQYHLNPIQLKAQIRDISASGCQIAFLNVNREFKEGEIMRGQVKFYRRPELQVECEIRHVRKVVEDDDKTYKILGIKFHNEDKDLEKKMRAVVLDLYRELFSTFSRRLKN